MLEHRHATLSQFFSPVVLETLAVEDPDVVLAPRETEVSVMFCDLRGFSLETERHAEDLMGLLARVSKAFEDEHNLPERRDVVGRLGAEKDFKQIRYRFFPFSGIEFYNMLDWVSETE